MLRTTLKFGVLVTFALSLFGAASAQDEDGMDFIYASYFTCPGGPLSEVDKVVDEQMAPLWDAAVEDGTITQWGWGQHHTGGKWMRLFSYGSKSIEGLFDASNEMMKRSQEANIDPDNVFGKTCTMHDDYIWQFTMAGGDPDNQGKAALSTYFQCKVAGEMKADDIFKKHIAPAYEAQIGDGGLTGYAMLNHMYGGKFRKIMVLNANSFSDLTKAHGAALESLFGEDGNNPEAMEFFQICNSHVDYLWNWKH